MDHQNIRIRAAVPEDAKTLLEIYRPYVEHTAITFEYEVPSEEEFEKRIRKVLSRYPYLVAEEDGQAAGYAYASPFKEREAYDWAVENSIYVDQNRKRRGIGGKLHEALEAALKEQGILNMNACIAWPREEDPYLTKNSVDFHGHLGYRLVGQFYQCGYKFGRWYDMVWMEKQIGEHLPIQPRPKTFEEIRGRIF
ncbi:MAG TPA: GNAT family N-acetyltransferase [Candidatus Enterocloster faecavium]|uniref:GNAT family N-acetyltransferase n=1 Tax=Candidatus Enterocloster faecavium TaxID=2838560 RepID=A0A9D2RIR1_9FIRM|nr:GNAT family N-acetyltransferase [Candidatus Enterocloster faecavium]